MPAKRASTATDSAPPSKRAKPGTSNDIKSQQGKQPVSTSQQTDDSGDAFWELSSGSTRRVTVNQFKGSWQVNIREYYNKDGAMLPGKKGISMPIDQWAALVQALPGIEKVLKEAGQEVPRPKFGGGASMDEGEAEVEEEQEEEEEQGAMDEADADGEAEEQAEEEAEEEEDKAVKPPASMAPQPAKTKPKSKPENKRNYEATDDEDDAPVPAAGSGASKLAKFKYDTA